MTNFQLLLRTTYYFNFLNHLFWRLWPKLSILNQVIKNWLLLTCENARKHWQEGLWWGFQINVALPALLKAWGPRLAQRSESCFPNVEFSDDPWECPGSWKRQLNEWWKIETMGVGLVEQNMFIVQYIFRIRLIHCWHQNYTL